MYLKRIEINQYRQLQNISLDFQRNLTVLAGPNNSGKTTLISVLKGVFFDKSFKLLYSDIPIHLSQIWLEKILPIFKEAILCDGKEIFIAKIVKELSKDNTFKDDFIIPEFRVKIRVDYDVQTDDIQLFVDYIMDLDDDKNSFYFVYQFEPSINLFEIELNEMYDKIKSKFEKIDKDPKDETSNSLIKKILLSIYCSCLKEKVYFTNSDYENFNSIDLSAFKNLFNFKNIQALRELDDMDNDSSKEISKRIISLIKDDSNWIQSTKNLPDDILQQILRSNAKEIIQKTSLNALDKTIQEISRISNGHVGTMQLEMDIDESDIEEFIKKITCAKYDVDGVILNESSQGLGFSNLIYLHLQLKDYLKSINNQKVNILFVEEPEAHMHPQMQSIFIRYLSKFYKEEKLQGLITTHSNEIVRNVGLENLRVLRQTEKTKSELFDLGIFKNSLKDETSQKDEDTSFVLENFFDWFFEIGYSEIIFADKAILYEGDTERLYIRKLINLPQFSSLKNNYIAFIQVGGAYAYNYQRIIEMLKIKTLIITDLDYDKTVRTIEDIKLSNSSNSTINKFYKLIKVKLFPTETKELDERKPTIQDLYDWQISTEYKTIINEKIYVAFQDEESTARTLEEAMLVKLLKQNVFFKQNRCKWKQFRKEHKLNFTIPRDKDCEEREIEIREIVLSTSEDKTDFMYSVILNGKEEEMLPEYIERGLKWLME